MNGRSAGGSSDRPIEGVLVVDKPAGPTSHDVVGRARRLLDETRIGHTGTLDPLATGVLPLVIGKATRLASMLSSTDKDYEATIRLGAVSDTYDAAGRVEPDPPVRPAIERAEVEAALEAFRGAFEQMPPPYSAKKVGGVPAYKLARKQHPTQLTAVRVTVHALDLLSFEDGRVKLHMRTSPGFYVRSLAHDLGACLGCGAYLESLRRTRAGRFGLEQAVRLADLEAEPDRASALVVPLEQLVPELPAVRLNARGAERASHGNSLRPIDVSETVSETGTLNISVAAPPEMLSVPVSGGRVRLFDPDGRLLAIAEQGADGLLRPLIVLV